MQQFHSRFKLHIKLLFSFAVLLGILFLAFYQIRDRLVEVDGEVRAVVSERRPIEQQSAQLNARLDDTLAMLGLYISVNEQVYADAYRRKIAEAMTITDALTENPLVADEPRFSEVLKYIRSHIDELSGLGEQVIRVSADDESRFPGLAYANKQINPINREILQLLSQLLMEEHSESSGNELRLMLQIADLRYYWVNVINGVRAYLAYRSERVLYDTELYYSSALQSLQDLMASGDALNEEENDLLHQLRDAMERFTHHWEQLQKIHTSEGWRADSHLMRTRIAPLYNEIKEDLDSFAQYQYNMMDALAGRLLSNSQNINHLVEVFLFVGMILGLAMAWGISRLVAIPIRQVAGAMESIASGEADLTQRLAAEGKDEVALLARSFNTFVDKAQQLAEEERALSQLLRLSLNPTDTDVYLRKALELMIGTVTWLGLLPTGGVFITSKERDGQLELVATVNFSPELLELCSTVPLGNCLCGRAAVSGEIEFAHSVDDRHDIHFNGMQPHGHYSVPIKSGSEVLGVLVLYLPDGYCRSANEERFLSRVAEVLSMGISLRQANADLLAAKQRAETMNDQLTGITTNIPGIIFQRCHSVNGEQKFTYVSPGTACLLGSIKDDPPNDIERLFNDIHHQDKQRVTQVTEHALKELIPINLEYRVNQEDGGTRWILCNAFPHRFADESVFYDGLLLDITDRKNLESQLLQAQKLESVGQLAAGIAHEINTPTQYVQDNNRFLLEAFEDFQSALMALRRLREPLPDSMPDHSLVEEVDQVLENADIDYLTEDIPQAINQSLEGLRRIASIVSAMKDFSHPGTDAKQPIDVNSVILSVVTVSRNEWKYVANLETELDENLLAPPGYRDKLGQVILNLIINCAHAIGDEVAAGRLDKGRILIRTSNQDGEVEIKVSDNGPGVPEYIKQKIFDPFFTTKDVGKGTGQGLSIARSVVVEQHQGSLTLDSTPGEGANFIIRLPLLPNQHKDESKAA